MTKMCGRHLLKDQPMNDEYGFHNIPIPPKLPASLLSLPWLPSVCVRTVTRNFGRFVDVTRRDTSTWGRESGKRAFLTPMSPT